MYGPISELQCVTQPFSCLAFLEQQGTGAVQMLFCEWKYKKGQLSQAGTWAWKRMGLRPDTQWTRLHDFCTKLWP